MFKEISAFCEEKNIDLVAVTKTRSIDTIMDLYNQGHRNFGENRVQELSQKFESMPKDIHWHMIGHLQSNKVKYIAEFVTMIHSGASFSLLKEINKRARQHERNIDVLLQIKIGQEEAKSGWDFDELINLLGEGKLRQFENLRIRGVMGMATFTDNTETVRSEFACLKNNFDSLKSNFFAQQDYFDTISMGMSNDYEIAVEEGATMVRIGSLLYS